jgi:hypothetical protein
LQKLTTRKFHDASWKEPSLAAQQLIRGSTTWARVRRIILCACNGKTYIWPGAAGKPD